MERNYIYNGFWIIALATVWILLYPYLHRSVPFLENNFQEYSLLDGISPDSLQENDESIFRNTGLAEENVHSDTLSSVSRFSTEENSHIDLLDPETIEPQETPFGDYNGYVHIQRFISALNKVQNGRRQCRIAYFGDSLVEGDLVTQTLRNKLQELFKGEGVGFVPITCQTAGFRQTIKHSFSSSWESFSFIKDNPTSFPYGINGEFFLANDPKMKSDSVYWVNYQGTSAYPLTETFHTVRLFYGHPGESTSSLPDAFNIDKVMVHTDYAVKSFHLTGTNKVNSTIISKMPSNSLRLEFDIRKNLPIYGISFEGGHGIYLDNYACRGNSGLPLIKLEKDVLQQFQKYMNYDLVILHYGLNAVAPDRTNFNRYKKGMRRVVRHLQKYLPQADILLISVNDKGTMIKGKLMTDPSVPILVKAQQQLAMELRLGFLNLYQKMGGRNSMIQWTKNGLGNKDYAHFSRNGADQVGKMINDFILNAQDLQKEDISEQALTQNNTNPIVIP